MNYAEKYSGQILEAIQQRALTSPFIESNVQWLGAKTFHFTQMNTSGYKTIVGRAAGIKEQSHKKTTNLRLNTTAIFRFWLTLPMLTKPRRLPQ